VRLTIIDTKLDRTYVVDKVPFGVGFIASMASSFSYKITNLIDNAFHTGAVVVWGAGTGKYVESVDYSRMGFAGMFDYVKMGLKINPKLFYVNDAPIEMQSYIEQCFFPYVSTLSSTDIDKLRKSKDLINDIKVPNSFLMSYNGQTWTCDEFYSSKLVPDWNTFVNTVSNKPYFFGFADYMASRIVDSINAMTNASLNFNQVITQSGIINMIKESYFTSGLADDMNNRLLASYAVGRAEEQSVLLGKAMFLWAKKVIPFMQNFLEAFFVILFPFLIILLFIPLAAFGGVKNAIGFLKVIVWVYLFIPILAVMDGMIKLQAINKTIAWLSSNGIDGITLGDYGFLLEQTDFFPAIAGFAAMSTPLWAWMLLQGFEAGISGMSSLIGSMG
ncbi:MAG: conjugal transfer protein TraG N-terminal domain-containing protein, partial [Acidimicrobiales bacterium]